MAAEAAHTGRRYRAFITYSHRDRRWAAWLHRRLEFYRVPRRLVGRRTGTGPVPRRLTPIFRDREELASADDLGERIADALARSDALIVVCSPAAARSRWVNEEILRFKRSGRANRIFCLITAGEPFASDDPDGGAQECFPPALHYRLDAAGEPTTQRAEPLAADVRPGGDGRTLALLKLVAGLLDLDLDLLRRRELQRRNRRWAAVTVVALLAMAGTSLLALEATIQRHAAERRQKQAEALVGFMLGELTEKLRPIGRLDILASLDKQAMKYFESLPPSDVDQQTLAQRAKALEDIAETRNAQGDYDGALEAINAELAITARLARKNPRDAKRQAAWASTLSFVGFMHYLQGKMPAAEKALAESVAAYKHAAALAPGDTDIQSALAEALNNIAQVAEINGEMEKARTYYKQNMQILMGLVAVDPGNVQWRNSLGNAWDNLGKLALADDQPVEAIRDYLQEARLVAALVKADPGNHAVQWHMVICDGILGRTLYLFGQARSGIHRLRHAVQIADALVAFDATRTDWRESRARYSDVLAGLLLEEGNVESAGELNQKALADLGMLTAKDPKNVAWISDLAAAKLMAARIAQAHGHRDETRRRAADATELANKAITAGSAFPDDDTRTAAAARLLLGDLAEAAGDRAAAGSYRRKALAMIAPLAKPPADPRNYAVAVAARLASGDAAGATGDIARLQHLGFRTPEFVAMLKAHGIDYPANVAVSKSIAQLIGTDAAAGSSAGRASDAGSTSSPSSQSGETP